jgi:hypothetical protein
MITLSSTVMLKDEGLEKVDDVVTVVFGAVGVITVR